MQRLQTWVQDVSLLPRNQRDCSLQQVTGGGGLVLKNRFSAHSSAIFKILLLKCACGQPQSTAWIWHLSPLIKGSQEAARPAPLSPSPRPWAAGAIELSLFQRKQVRSSKVGAVPQALNPDSRVLLANAILGFRSWSHFWQ
jgi:hypothetical protein